MNQSTDDIVARLFEDMVDAHFRRQTHAETAERAVAVIAEWLETNTQLPDTWVRWLTDSYNLATKQAMAGAENLPEQVVDIFADHQSDTVRDALAASPHTPAEILDRIYVAGEPEVRATALTNPNLSADTMLKAVEFGEHWEVRLLAERRGLPENVVAAVLATDEEAALSRLCANPDVDETTKRRIHVALTLWAKARGFDPARFVSSVAELPLNAVELAERFDRVRRRRPMALLEDVESILGDIHPAATPGGGVGAGEREGGTQELVRG